MARRHRFGVSSSVSLGSAAVRLDGGVVEVPGTIKLLQVDGVVRETKETSEEQPGKSERRERSSVTAARLVDSGGKEVRLQFRPSWCRDEQDKRRKACAPDSNNVASSCSILHNQQQHHHLSQDPMALQQHFTGLLPPDSGDPKSDHHHQAHLGASGGPNWLSNAILGSSGAGAGTNFLNLQTNSDSSSAAQAPSNQWLSRAIDDSSVLSMPNDNGDDGGGSGKVEVGDGASGGGDGVVVNWQNAKYKAEILSHPLYEQLLSAHVACLKIATPVDQLPRIDAQLAQSQNVVAKYSAMAANGPHMVGDDKELDQFMTHYVLLLCSFKEQLQQHVRVHAMEAVMACWEIEQSLQSLTGVSPGEGTGATMSDDEDEPLDGDSNMFDGGMDGVDNMGFGLPTESERTLMERVRQELKHELKQGYKEKIVDIREEILRKRRAGKLPGDTTSVLKAWWQSHSKWPYPTEEDKARLVQETGLQLKQINNWFINQRKRNWHSNPSSSTVMKSKRKR